MSKHTPGPWEVINEKHKSGKLFTGVFAVNGDGDHWICRITENNDKDFNEELANARLIAAAPELLLACQGALAALLLAPHVSKDQAIEYLREVISKAEGKE